MIFFQKTVAIQVEVFHILLFAGGCTFATDLSTFLAMFILVFSAFFCAFGANFSTFI
jgi:hypothetical protein